MSVNSIDQQLTHLENLYATEIRAALLREDDLAAERLGRAYDKKVARLSARREGSSATLRDLARRLTPSRAA